MQREHGSRVERSRELPCQFSGFARTSHGFQNADEIHLWVREPCWQTTASRIIVRTITAPPPASTIIVGIIIIVWFAVIICIHIKINVHVIIIIEVRL